jgi:hypothetical protein
VGNFLHRSFGTVEVVVHMRATDRVHQQVRRLLMRWTSSVTALTVRAVLVE